MKTKKIILYHLLIISICLALNVHCSGDRNKEKIIAEYTIKLKGPFIIYGININKILNKKFSEIEKELNSKTRVDEEVSVIFIYKEKNFVTKSINTRDRDAITIKYGPIDDTSIYKKYKEVIPYSMEFYGGLNTNEKANTKNSVIKELQKNLPDNNLTRKALSDIQNTFVKGDYKAGLVIVINFEMSEFPTVRFSIGFTTIYKNEIFYRYTFSRKDVVYPP